MEKQIEYKKQGDGRDSWKISVFEGEKLVSCEMVYEDPNQERKTDLSNIDLASLTIDQLKQLKAALALV
ncbi:MAG: hypothetical protein M3R27_05860 [Bacteroidota bacterium]|nr:hypothetical protein [Bacteroidota bacterium]